MPEEEKIKSLIPGPTNPLHIERALTSGWVEKDMGGVGDCIFSAWIKVENHYHGKEQSEAAIAKAAFQVRLKAVKRIRKHKNFYL